VQRTENWYLEQMETPNGKTSSALYPTPGFLPFGSLPASGGAMLYHKGRLFVVAGTVVYEMYATGTFVVRGAVAAGTRPATICTNGDMGDEVFITSGGHGYILTLSTNAFAQVLTDISDVGGFLDGYFLALDADDSTLYISSFVDGLTWDPLDKAQRQTAPDPWVGMLVSDRQIHLFGTATTETWYNDGNPDFPFTPIQGSLIRDGIAAPYSSLALVDNTRIWLTANPDGTGVIKRAAGFVPERISTHAIEHAIQGYDVTSDAEAWSYQEDGHIFYALNFPTARATWVYDATNPGWHKRGWWDAQYMRFDSSRVRCHVYAFDKHLVCDRLTGDVYQQTLRSNLDMGGTPLRRLRQGPHLTANNKLLYYPEVRLILESGIGTAEDPQVMLQWSDDGGHTWSNERWTSAGKLGEYGRVATWRRCGSSRDRVFRFTVADDMSYRLLDMQVGADN
jgi:hypothetical protein